MRKLMFFAIATSVLLIASAAFAADDDTSLAKMNGKELFKTQCKPCHAADSEFEEYTPMTLIADQWDEFFDEYYLEAHEEVPSLEDESKSVTEFLDDEVLKKIHKFCVDHAADSEQPMTCG